MSHNQPWSWFNAEHARPDRWPNRWDHEPVERRGGYYGEEHLPIAGLLTGLIAARFWPLLSGLKHPVS